MKVEYLIFFIFIFFSCKISTSISELPSTNTKVEYFGNGYVKSIGNVEDFFLKENSFRIGFWSEFYENGKLKESGNYKLDTYVECCTNGYCPGFYSYKVGDWVYYHDNGELKARGVYRIGKISKETNCGSDEINFGFVTPKWKFFNKDGDEIIPTEFDILEIEKTSYLDQWSMLN